MPRFSRRLDWDTPHNALAERLARHRELRRSDDRADDRDSGDGLLDLTISNPTRAGIAYPEAELKAALTDENVLAGALRYEPSPQGLPEARRAIADYYAARGIAVSPEHILLTASTSEAYAFLFKLLADPGDVVLVPRPSYPLFDFLAAVESVRLAPYELGFDGAFHLDIAALQHSIAAAQSEGRSDGRSVRAILLVSPNNPTGTFLKRDERDALVEIARANDLALICDEVFGDYAFGPDPRRVPSLASEPEVLTFTLSGLSKVVGLPQLKLGWITVSGPPDERDRALARLELVADTFLSVAAPVQLATPALLDLRGSTANAIAARTRANLAALHNAIRGTAIDCLPVEGGWYACLRLPAVRTDEEWALALLDEDRVLVQPGYFYDFASDAHVVVSLLGPEDVFCEGVRRLCDRVAVTIA